MDITKIKTKGVMKTIAGKVLLIGLLLLICWIHGRFIDAFFPLKHPDINWGLTVSVYSIACCAIIVLYGILFPRPAALYAALILQTAVAAFLFSPPNRHPLRSIDLTALGYLLIIMPWAVNRLINYVRKRKT